MKRLFAVFAVLFLLAVPAWAQDQAEPDNCDPYPDVPVIVTPVMGNASFDNSTNIAGLRTLETTTPHFYERLLMGVTTYKPFASVDAYPKIIKMLDGNECVKFSKVEVKIGYQDIVVHVANEIPQGSCGFDAVIAHEQKHVAVNQQVFQQYAPQIEQKLKDFLKLNGVLQERNYGYTMTVLHDNMKAIVQQIMQDMDQQEQAQQPAVDSNAEFQQLTTACGGQLSQIALQFRQTGR